MIRRHGKNQIVVLLRLLVPISRLVPSAYDLMAAADAYLVLWTKSEWDTYCNPMLGNCPWILHA
jgi:hypothetical protein